jgi:hypothetical protein
MRRSQVSGIRNPQVSTIRNIAGSRHQKLVVLQCGHSARTPSVITQFPHAARRVPFTAGLLYLPLQLNLLAGHGTSSLMSSTVLQQFCRCLSER